MSGFYTLASWRVKEGLEEEFVRAWREDLAGAFLDLPGVGAGTLLQSVEEPRQFYSFGPWDSLEAIQAMRQNPDAREAIDKLMDLCDEAKPGAFRVAATVP